MSSNIIFEVSLHLKYFVFVDDPLKSLIPRQLNLQRKFLLPSPGANNCSSCSVQLELKLIPPESLCSLELLPLHNLGENLAIFMLSSLLSISCTLMHRYAEAVKKAQIQNDDVVLQGEGRLYSHFMNTLGFVSTF